jgi:signal transduction histidine kinase/ActR/RegA family two-component response regulator
MTDDTDPGPPPDPVGAIVAEIALLYELAMAVGRSLDLRSNCEQFIRVLMARKNLSYAAVWLRRDLMVDTPLNRAVPEAAGPSLALVYAHPQYRVEQTVLPANHPMLALLGDQGAYSVAAGQPGFAELVTERRIAPQGAFALLSLNGLGVLKFYSMARVAPFSEVELNQLRPVVGQFARSLASSLHHQRALREEQVRDARKLEAVAILAGGVAHDFNNILQAIRGYTELLQERFQVVDAVAAADLQTIIGQVNQATTLTRQLLAFGRRSMLTRQPIDLDLLLAGLAPKWTALAGPAIAVHVRPSSRPAMVRADAESIQQMLLCLVENAIEAMPAGGCLDVGLEPVSLAGTRNTEEPAEVPAGDYFRLSVTDTGCGMTADARKHLFEPFFTTKFVGAGLGLPAAYGIVKQHDGAMQVDSEPDRGTTVRVFLPALAAALAPETPADARAGSGTCILVVEDEKHILEIVKLVLGQRQYRILVAHDVQQARALYDQAGGTVDLLISDMVLTKDGDGISLANQLRQRQPRLGVVLMSAYTDYQTRWPAIIEHGYRFLAKPFTLAHLVATVEEELVRSKPIKAEIGEAES